MSNCSHSLLTDLVSPAVIEEIDTWIAKYPPEQRQSAVMQALMIVQREKGYLTTELQNAIAQYLRMPAIAVYEVSTFYSMYEHKPLGRNLINVCTNISCALRGSSETVAYLENKLGIALGETTEDQRYTLRAVECLGACVGAPMMQVNQDYHENLNAEKIDQILEEYK